MNLLKYSFISLSYISLLFYASISSAFESASFHSTSNNKNIELSVFDEDYAKVVYNQIINDEKNAFNYPIDGCYARAHQMSMLMDKLNIISGKIFIEGKFLVETKMREVNWSYHVASLVAIKINNSIDLYVIDPILFNKPISIASWKDYLTQNSKSKITDLYLTKRFNYQPDSKYDDLNDYLEEEILNAQNTNKMNFQDGETLKKFIDKGLTQ